MKKDLLMKLSKWFPKIWYQESSWMKIFSPFSWVFLNIVKTRRFLYRKGLKSVTRLPVPVIVVGNITVGGVGKTPVVIQLAEWFKQNGLKPGLISRGYGGHAKQYPVIVHSDSDSTVVGDEALLLMRRTQCPMVVAPDRVAAAKLLLEKYDIDIILSDDGLQHYALARDIEIVVVDATRGYGNGLCLPVGPLREPISRMNEVDFVIFNGVNKVLGSEKFRERFYSMTIKPLQFINVLDSKLTQGKEYFQGKSLHAVAAIGNPQRFFRTLRDMGLEFTELEFPDHYHFMASDLEFSDNSLILMTEKDAMKCRGIANVNSWYLSVSAVIDGEFEKRVLEKLLSSRPSAA
ncbi:MAG: tetraacyldisaccharide 4'-kinase [Proteobacteria bacterium]|nr:tetraacyldisaccharide 4'-kinase [Pseudomonadota bacterium]